VPSNVTFPAAKSNSVPMLFGEKAQFVKGTVAKET